MKGAIATGDALTNLKRLPPNVAQTCVSSPPYFGLRDYGVEGQIGLEASPDAYVERVAAVFNEVRRVLRPDGTLWLNLGDTYAGSGCGARDPERWPKQSRNDHMPIHAKKRTGLPNKNLIGIPWRVAFALQADGWYLRQDIIWHKPNPMPASVTDRCVSAHEYIFLLAKSERYYFDHLAIRENATGMRSGNGFKRPERISVDGRGSDRRFEGAEKRNKRDVWTVSPRPFKEAHFATFPPQLIQPCVLAGSRPGDLVIDPFNGAGTTGLVALELGRRYWGCELNPEYVALSRRRLGLEAAS